MEWLSQIEVFVKDDYFQGIVAVIGMICGIIPIVQAINPTKRIRYKIARNDNVYAVCFWNASVVPVFGDDVFHFYAIVNDQAQEHLLFRTEIDLPIKCMMSENAEMRDPHTGDIFRGKFKVLDFCWDFLPSHAGAIVEIRNNTSLTIDHKLIVNGRIKGGKATSVSMARLPFALNRKPLSKCEPIMNGFLSGFLFLFYALTTCMVLLAVYLDPSDMLGWIAIVGFLMFDFVWIRKTILNSMPYKLRKAFMTVCKNNNLEISYEKHDYSKCIRYAYY